MNRLKIILSILLISSISNGSIVSPRNSTEALDGEIIIADKCESGLLDECERGGCIVDNVWTALPVPEGYRSHAGQISANGGKIMGMVWKKDPETRAYTVFCGGVWDMIDWDNDLPVYTFSFLSSLDGDAGSRVTDMSNDGKYIVGESIDSLSVYRSQACYWDASGNVYSLGQLSYDSLFFDESISYAVSDNGIIVGTAIDNSMLVQDAFIWDSVHGIRNLQDVLINDYGYNFVGYDLRDAMYINSEGTYMSGFGYDPEGNAVMWEATIPEPATILLTFSGTLFVFIRRRKNNH